MYTVDGGKCLPFLSVTSSLFKFKLCGDMHMQQNREQQQQPQLWYEEKSNSSTRESERKWEKDIYRERERERGQTAKRIKTTCANIRGRHRISLCFIDISNAIQIEFVCLRENCLLFVFSIYYRNVFLLHLHFALLWNSGQALNWISIICIPAVQCMKHAESLLLTYVKYSGKLNENSNTMIDTTKKKVYIFIHLSFCSVCFIAACRNYTDIYKTATE